MADGIPVCRCRPSPIRIINASHVLTRTSAGLPLRPATDYIVGELLGEGGFGRVYECIDNRDGKVRT